MCGRRAIISLQLQRHGGTAHMTGMLSQTATCFLGNTGLQGEVVELLFMSKSNWNVELCLGTDEE